MRITIASATALFLLSAVSLFADDITIKNKVRSGMRTRITFEHEGNNSTGTTLDYLGAKTWNFTSRRTVKIKVYDAANGMLMAADTFAVKGTVEITADGKKWKLTKK